MTDQDKARVAEIERLGAELDRREIDPLKCPSCDEYRKETARLRADLAAMTAERDALRERAEAAERDLISIAQEMFSDDSENLRGNWYPCDVCANAKFDESGTGCWECFAAAYNNDTTAFKWRGPTDTKGDT